MYGAISAGSSSRYYRLVNPKMPQFVAIHTFFKMPYFPYI
jgi:hypothetical protein